LRAATTTYDHKRNGTTNLFAALNVLVGQVIGQCQQPHPHRVIAVSAPNPNRRAAASRTRTPSGMTLALPMEGMQREIGLTTRTGASFQLPRSPSWSRFARRPENPESSKLRPSREHTS
jgi:hypothetical protein